MYDIADSAVDGKGGRRATVQMTCMGWGSLTPYTQNVLFSVARIIIIIILIISSLSLSLVLSVLRLGTVHRACRAVWISVKRNWILRDAIKILAGDWQTIKAILCNAREPVRGYTYTYIYIHTGIQTTKIIVRKLKPCNETNVRRSWTMKVSVEMSPPAPINSAYHRHHHRHNPLSNTI